MSGSLKFFGTRRKSSSSTWPDQRTVTLPTVTFAWSFSPRMEEIFDFAMEPITDGPTITTIRRRPSSVPPPRRRIFFQRLFFGAGAGAGTAAGGGGGDGGARSGVVMKRAFYRG